MIRYSIADLENLTGIRAHTIRIWERRYGLISPHRTDTNIRYYDNDQMRKLVNVGTLLRAGMKISKISSLSEQEMNVAISNILSGQDDHQDSLFDVYTGQLITAGLRFDEQSFDQALSNAIRRFGMQTCYREVLLPMLKRVGIFWSVSDMNPAQEHFITSLVKQKLYAAIDALPPAPQQGKSILLFLPQNEFHELGLLMAKYILRSAGRRVIYLGARVPYDNLRSTVDQCNPDQLLFFLIQMHPIGSIQEYVDRLSKDFGAREIYVSGQPFIMEELEIPGNLTWIRDLAEFETVLT